MSTFIFVTKPAIDDVVSADFFRIMPFNQVANLQTSNLDLRQHASNHRDFRLLFLS